MGGLSWKLTKGHWLEPSISSLCFICCIKISFNLCNHSCCEGTTSVSPVIQLMVRKVSGCTVCGTRGLGQHDRSVDFSKHFNLLGFIRASIQGYELSHHTMWYSRYASNTGLLNRVVFVPTSTSVSTHPIE